MQTILPPRLKKGDTVGIISPSQPLQKRQEAFENALDVFSEALEVNITVAPHALGRHYYSSGTTTERLADFHQMIADPQVKAIIFSVGGDSAIDLVEGLDYELIKKHPKIITGISDASTLLNPITAKTGLITFLGLEFTDFGRAPMDYEIAQIKRTLFAGESGVITANPNWHDFDDFMTTYSGWQTIKAGTAQGRIVGGNLTCFDQLFGTAYFPELQNNILVIESYKFHKSRLHRMLQSLRLRGLFDQISGLLIGYCLGSDDPNEIGDEQSMKELLLEVTEGYNFPIMQIGEIGHNVDNIMLPIGAKATMNATTLAFSIDEPCVK